MKNNQLTFPFIANTTFFHVGTLNKKDKKTISGYEGQQGISIGLHPDDWRQVARIAGDTFSIKNEQAKILDLHKTMNDPQLSNAIIQFGKANNYIIDKKFYIHSYFDDEMDSEVEGIYETKEEALCESNNDIDSISSRIQSCATSKLCSRMGLEKIDPINAMDFLTCIYAEDALNIDGIWWNDIYDPLSYSLPRGLIFESSLNQFTIENLSNNQVIKTSKQPSMKINTIIFDANDLDEDTKEDLLEYSYKDKNSILTQLMVNVAKSLEELPELKNLQYSRSKEEAEHWGVPEKPEEDIEIDVLFVDDQEIMDYWYAPENSLGLHAMTSGIYAQMDNNDMSMKHRVVIKVDQKALDKFIKESREEEFNPNSNRYIGEYIRSYLKTITHEIAHLHEFIFHAHGLVPAEAETQFDNGESYLSLNDLVTGNGIYSEFSDDLSDTELNNELTEERVEAKADLWLQEAKFDHNLFNQLADQYIIAQEDSLDH